MTKAKEYGSRVFDRKVAEAELGPLDHDHSEDDIEREVYSGLMMTKIAIWAAAALTVMSIVMSN